MNRQDRKAMLFGVSVASTVGAALFVWLMVAIFRDSGGKSTRTDSKPKEASSNQQREATGIDRQKVLQHMTSESNTVVLFDEYGGVVSTGNINVLHTKPFVAVMIAAAKDNVPAMSTLKGQIFVCWSAEGIGNRLTIEKAAALLDDCLRAQKK